MHRKQARLGGLFRVWQLPYPNSFSLAILLVARIIRVEFPDAHKTHGNHAGASQPFYRHPTLRLRFGREPSGNQKNITGGIDDTHYRR